MVRENPEFAAQVTEATYDGGVLRPVAPLALREHERVRIIVQTLGTGTQNRDEALARLRAGIESMSFRSSQGMPSRDDLHERG